MTRHLRFAIVCGVLLGGLLLGLGAVTATLVDARVRPIWALAYAPFAFATAACLWLQVRRWRRQEAAPAGATFRFLFQALVVGWIVLALTMAPFRLVKLELGLALVVGLFAVGLMMRPVLTRNPKLARIDRGVDLVVLNLCILALGLELGMRGINTIHPLPILATAASTAQERVDAHRTPAGCFRYGFKSNARGHYDTEFRTPENRDGRVVLAIGDSFSAGVVPHRFHFTTVAEQDLTTDTDAQIEIYNMGVPAIAAAGHRHLWETEGRQLRPDLVVINVFVGNDVIESTGYEGRHTLLRSWFDRRNVLLLLVPLRMWRMLQAQDHDNGQGPNLANILGLVTDHEIHEEAELLQRFPWLTDPMREPATIPAAQFLEIERERARGLLFPTPGNAYEIFFKALGDLLEVLAADDTRCMVMLIPDEFQVNDALWEQVRQGLPGSGGGDDHGGRFSPQGRIRAWVEDRGVPCLDLLPVMRAVPPLADGERHLYQRQDTHWNRRGNAVAGRALSAFLRKHFRSLLTDG